MSIEVMSKVWRCFPGSGGQMLCMLALANWCNDEGGSLHPSISTLAAYMRVSESQARRTLHSLFPENDAALASGDWYVRVVDNEGGGAPGTTRQYALNVARLDELRSMVPVRETGRTDARGSVGARGGMNARDGSHGCKGTGSTHATRTIIEPLEDPKRESAREEDQFEEAIKAWPSGFADSREQALTAWSALTPDEATVAVAEIRRYVSSMKAIGRSHVCGFDKYLIEKRWLGLPDRPTPTVVRPQGTSPRPIKMAPTAFQRANPHLYPELFAAGSNGEAPAGPAGGG